MESVGWSSYIYIYPIGSMCGIFPYIWLKFMINVGKYPIHGSYGYIHLYQKLLIVKANQKTSPKLIDHHPPKENIKII